MQDSQSPSKVKMVWANNAQSQYVTFPVPDASQIGITNGAASFTDGFPPLNFTALSAGGAGPFGKDFNGLLKQLTSNIQWWNAGGPITYDAAFSTAVGGYPLGAVVASSATPGLFWISTIDNNVSNPDTGGSNWQSAYITGSARTYQIFNSSGVFSPGIGVTRAHVRIWAGGAGGGGAQAGPSAASGGGAGGYAEDTITVIPGVPIVVTVGSGGIAGGAAGGNGGGGGSSSFGTYLSATGGTPGLGATSGVQTVGGIGGNGFGGSLILQGQGGATAYFSTGSFPVSGQGGAAPFNGPGFSGTGTNPGNGGFFPGGGGSGAVTQGVTAEPGGVGAGGLITVESWG